MYQQNLPDIKVTEEIVQEKLSNLDVRRKAQGPDSINPWIY